MMKSYYFAGNEVVGAYVRGVLTAHDWACEDAPEDAEVVITYFTTATALEDEYFGTDGIIKRAAPKTLLINLSPATPNFARDLSAVAQVNDMRPVEAPIVVLDTTRDNAFSDSANIAAFVAGDKSDIEAATDVLELIVGNAQVMGAAGSAVLARAALAIQVAAQIISAVEADALYRAIQRDPASEGDIEGSAGAASPHAEQVLSAVAEKRFSGTYTIEMFMGELAAAMAAADDIDLVLPQLEAGMRVLELLAVIGGVDMSPAALALLYRDEDEVRAAGLDWSRAAEYYSTDAQADDSADDYDAEEDADDHECCGGHHHHGEGECTCGHDHHHEDDPYEGIGYDDGYAEREYQDADDFFNGR